MEWLTGHGYMPQEDTTFSRADLAVDFVAQTYSVDPQVLRQLLFNRMPRGRTKQERFDQFDAGLNLLSEDSDSILPGRRPQRQLGGSGGGLGDILRSWD